MAEPIDYSKARRHLGRRDPVLKRLLAEVGPCTLAPDPDGFAMLTRSIVSQQISTKAAQSIGARLRATLGGAFTPEALLAQPDDALRGSGLSAGKVRSLRDLADKVRSGELPLDRLPEMGDEEAIAALLPVRGIGRWTAQMYLIFSLGRPDVLAADDLGLRAGVRDRYGLGELPGKQQLTELAEPWRPFRSVATWYLWRSRDAAAKPAPKADPR